MDYLWTVATVVLYAVFFGAMVLINKRFEKKNEAMRRGSELRYKVIQLIFKHPDWRRMSEDFDDVSFEDFIKEYESGRDPIKLMSPGIQAMMAARDAARRQLPDNVIRLN